MKYKETHVHLNVVTIKQGDCINLLGFQGLFSLLIVHLISSVLTPNPRKQCYTVVQDIKCFIMDWWRDKTSNLKIK